MADALGKRRRVYLGWSLWLSPESATCVAFRAQNASDSDFSQHVMKIGPVFAQILERMVIEHR